MSTYSIEIFIKKQDTILQMHMMANTLKILNINKCTGQNNTKRKYNKIKAKFNSVMNFSDFSFFFLLFSTREFSKMSLYQTYVLKRKANICKCHYNNDKAK